MRVYVPTNWGDVRFERISLELTKVTISDVTEFEKQLLTKFLKSYKLAMPSEGGFITIAESLDSVHKRFVRIFKKGRPVINAIKVDDGKVEIVQDFSDKDAIGVSIEKPPRGCPMPIWERKEVRAIEVLREFLSRKQWLDFEKYKSFISRGNYSGHPYLLTSRWSPLCEGLGILYSLVKQNVICASLPNVPPSEELLAMKICVECDERRFVGIGNILGL